MTTPSKTPAAPGEPTAFGWCAWHQGNASGIRLINVHEQGSGPGDGAFACQPCREKNGLTPLADQSLRNAG